MIPIDIRVIAATNRYLEEMVRVKQFLEDLCYRISVLTMRSLSLNQRENDIELLTRDFVKQNFIFHICGVKREAIDYLQTLQYPVNIRQLLNIVERAMVLCADKELDLETVVPAASRLSFSPEIIVLGGKSDDISNIIQNEKIGYTLEQNYYSRTKGNQHWYALPPNESVFGKIKVVHWGTKV